jgi:molybdopterin-binding protein
MINLGGDYMKISARNLIKGRIVAVKSGEVMSNVKIQITNNPDIMTAIITRDAVDDLQLGEQDDVTLVIKSTEIMVAKKS